MKGAAKKMAEVEQAAVRLVATPPKDEFTLIETIIAEIRAMPKPEAEAGSYWTSVENIAIRRRNERLEASRVVAYEQLANACLSDQRLLVHMRRAGL